MNLQENIQRIRQMMGINENKEQKKVQIFADGGGSEWADVYDGEITKIPIKDTIPNEPFKDTSYMEKSDNIKNMIKSINDGEKLPPIRVIQHPQNEKKYLVVDGNHRRFAFSKSNVKDIDAIVIPHRDVVLMKSKWGDKEKKLGNLDKFKEDTEIIKKYFVNPDGSNNFDKNKDK